MSVYKNILKGVIISFLCTLLLLLIYAIILTYTDFSESSIVPVIMIISSISILIGSSIGNYKIKKGGMANGALIGMLYFIIIYLLSSIINMNFEISMQVCILVLTGIIFGILGGIIGVNKK